MFALFGSASNVYIIFLSVIQKAQSDYEEKLKAVGPSEQAMFSLTWDIDASFPVKVDICM